MGGWEEGPTHKGSGDIVPSSPPSEGQVAVQDEEEAEEDVEPLRGHPAKHPAHTFYPCAISFCKLMTLLTTKHDIGCSL